MILLLHFAEEESCGNVTIQPDLLASGLMGNDGSVSLSPSPRLPQAFNVCAAESGLAPSGEPINKGKLSST